MKIRILTYVMCLTALLFLCSCMNPVPVIQGKCISFNRDNNMATVEEFNTDFSPQYPYGQSTGKQVVFNISEAVIGITPVAGDIIRVAYQMKGSHRVALRIMNVSRQDIMKK